jgi:glycosyltransferase involved in cell wall biosynthesis
MQPVYLVCPWFGIFAGGAERAVRQLALELRARGVDAQVLTTCCGELYGDWTVDGLAPGLGEFEGIPVHRFPVNKDSIHLYHAAVQAWVSGESVSKASQYDFFSHGISSDALVEYVGKLDSGDSVVTCPYFHAVNFRTITEHPGRVHLLGAFHDEPQFYWQPVRDMFDKARGVLFLAPEEKQLAIQTYGLRRGRDLVESPVLGLGTELPPGIDSLIRDVVRIDAIRENSQVPERYLICVGRKEVSKGVSKLVSWVSSWNQRREAAGQAGIPVVFLGGGDDTLIPDDPQFINLGFVEEAHKFALMRGALATVNLSSFESFSFVVMESWLCGTPVIVSSECAVTRGHVARCGAGYSVSGPNDFSSAVDALCDPAYAQKLGAAGREHVLEHYNWDAVIDRFARAVGLE